MHPKIKIKIKKTHNSRKEADKYKLCVQGTIVLQSQGYNSHSFLFFFPTPKKGCIRCCHNWKFIDIHFHCQSTHTAATQPDFFQWGCWALLKPRTTPACLKEWGNQLQLGSVLQHSSWACALTDNTRIFLSPAWLACEFWLCCPIHCPQCWFIQNFWCVWANQAPDFTLNYFSFWCFFIAYIAKVTMVRQFIQHFYQANWSTLQSISRDKL